MATIPTKKISELTTKTDTPTTETYVPVAEKSGETFSTKKFDLQNVYAELGNKLGKTEKAADADKLDGNDSTYFATADDLTSHTTDTNNPHNVTAAQLGAANILTQIKTVDGAGSGLDADLLDGKQATEFANAVHTHTTTNITDFNIWWQDSLRTSVEAASGGKVTVLYDDLGNPSYMVRIPAFNLQDIDPNLGTGLHPAFIVNGVEKSEIFIGQYQARVINGRACSLPNVDPSVSMTYDQAVSYCTSKGTGWHLMTAHEWAAVMLWCLKNGFQPRGNTNFGRSYEMKYETGVRVDNGVPGSTSGTPRTLTGSGAVSWRHDNTFSGIADLVGNVWEWLHLLKLVDGRIYCPLTNDYNSPEANWPAQDAYFDGISGQLLLSDSKTNNITASNVTWSTLNIKANWDPPVIIKQLGIIHKKYDGTITSDIPIFQDIKGSIWCNNVGERLFLRGGSYLNAHNSGIGAYSFYELRTNINIVFGFRPAYIP